MRIAHASDLHGNYKLLNRGYDSSAVSEQEGLPDLWIISGDFFPNYGRGPKTGYKINSVHERNFQSRWWGYKSNSIMDRLGGKPIIWVGGNHDFISLSSCLRSSKYPGQVFDLSEGPVDFGGQRFAGFREIPYIAGEWVGETQAFSEIISKALEQDPTILVTHAPPGGILDYDPTYDHCGIPALTAALTYRPHRITHHFFGHVHPDGNKTHFEMNILFINSSQTVQTVEV